MAEYRAPVQLICVCGHPSVDHDPWPECTECECEEYEGRIPESKRGLR